MLSENIQPVIALAFFLNNHTTTVPISTSVTSWCIPYTVCIGSAKHLHNEPYEIIMTVLLQHVYKIWSLYVFHKT